MLSKTITIKSDHGLHLRVAAQVVKASKKHETELTLYQNGKKANAHSILELMMLEATRNSTVTVVAEGKDESAAMRAVEQVLIDGAGI